MFNKKKIAIGLTTALLLTGVLGISAGAAEPVGSDTRPTEFKVQKTLQMDEKVTEYPAFNFTIEFTQLTSKEQLATAIGAGASGSKFKIDDENVVKLISSEPVPLKPVTISYNSATDTKTPGTVTNIEGEQKAVKNVIKKADLTKEGKTTVLAPGDFQVPGLYVYKVTEKDVSFNNTITSTEGSKKITTYDELTCSKAEYIMVIPVGYEKIGDTYNYAAGLKFIMSDAVILQTKDSKGTTVDEKASVPDFTNVYQRNDDDDGPKEYGLKIKKSVAGKYASTTEEFPFKITIHANATETSNSGYTAKVYNVDTGAVVTGEGKVLTAKFGEENSFKLKHNEELRFDKFPVGTTWQITEETPAGYIATATGITGNTHVTYTTQANFQEAHTIEQGDNRLDVLNTKGDTPITGIVTDNLSFILLIVVAVAGMTAYVMMKRRLRNR